MTAQSQPCMPSFTQNEESEPTESSVLPDLVRIRIPFPNTPKQYYCPVCSAAYTRRDGVQSHCYRKHSVKVRYLYECEHCNAQFEDMTRGNKHITTCEKAKAATLQAIQARMPQLKNSPSSIPSSTSTPTTCDRELRPKRNLSLSNRRLSPPTWETTNGQVPRLFPDYSGVLPPQMQAQSSATPWRDTPMLDEENGNITANMPNALTQLFNTAAASQSSVATRAPPRVELFAQETRVSMPTPQRSTTALVQTATQRVSFEQTPIAASAASIIPSSSQPTPWDQIYFSELGQMLQAYPQHAEVLTKYSPLIVELAQRCLRRYGVHC